MLEDLKVAGVIKQARLRNSRKKENKGGHCHRYEPMDMNFLNEDPTSMEVFQKNWLLAILSKVAGFSSTTFQEFF